MGVKGLANEFAVDVPKNLENTEYVVGIGTSSTAAGDSIFSGNVTVTPGFSFKGDGSQLTGVQNLLTTTVAAANVASTELVADSLVARSVLASNLAVTGQLTGLTRADALQANTLQCASTASADTLLGNNVMFSRMMGSAGLVDTLVVGTLKGTVAAANTVTANIVSAGLFVGNAAGLTNLPAGQLRGLVPPSSLPAQIGNVVTFASVMGSTVMGHSLLARHLVASAGAVDALTAQSIRASNVTAPFIGNASTTIVANTLTASTYMVAANVAAPDLVIAPRNSVKDFMAQHLVFWSSGITTTYSIPSFNDVVSLATDATGNYITYPGVSGRTRTLTLQTYQGAPLLRRGWAGTVSWTVRKSVVSARDSVQLQTSLDGLVWSTVYTLTSPTQDFSGSFAFSQRMTVDTFLRLVITSADAGTATYTNFYSMRITPSPLDLPVVPQVSSNSSSTFVIYVSPNGNDSASGTSPDQPLLTLAAARAVWRPVRLLTGRPVTVLMRRGSFFLRGQLAFDERDSGVTIQAFVGETVTIRQGVAVPASAFVPLSPTAHSFVYPQISSNVAANVVVLDLSPYNVNVSDEPWGWGAISPSGRHNWQPLRRTKLFINGTACTLARYPKASTPYLQMPRVVSVSAAGGNVGGVQYAGGTFTYTPSFTRPAAWQPSSDMWATGIFSESWEIRHNAATANATTQQLTFTYPNQLPLISYNDARQWFYIENVVEEITDPGDYVIDSTRKLLFLLPPIGGISASSDIALWTNEPVQNYGDQYMITVSGAANMTFANLRFAYCSVCPLMILEGRNTTVTGCAFVSSAAGGVDIRSTNCLVQNCTFADLGGGGAIIAGGSVKDDVFPGNCSVDTCTFDNCTAFYYASFCAILGYGVQNAIRNCVFLRSPTDFAGAWPNYGSTIENNQFYDALGAWMDEGYLDINLGVQGIWSNLGGNSIRGNYFHGKDYAIATPVASLGQGLPWRTFIYLDNGTSGWSITQNCFYNSADRAINTNGGTRVAISNNLFVDCGSAYQPAFMSFDALSLTTLAANWTADWISYFSLPKFASTELAAQQPWLVTLLANNTTVQQLFNPPQNTFDNNILYNPQRTLQGAVLSSNPAKNEAALTEQSGTVITTDRSAAKRLASQRGVRQMDPVWYDPALFLTTATYGNVAVANVATMANVVVTGTLAVTGTLSAPDLQVSSLITAFTSLANVRVNHYVTSNNDALGGLTVSSDGAILVVPNAATYGTCTLTFQPYNTRSTGFLPVGWTGTLQANVQSTTYNYPPSTTTTVNDWVQLWGSTDNNTWTLLTSVAPYYDPTLLFGYAPFWQFPNNGGIGDRSLTYTPPAPLAAATYVQLRVQAYSRGSSTTIKFYGLSVSNVTSLSALTSTVTSNLNASALSYGTVPLSVLPSSLTNSSTLSARNFASLAAARAQHVIVSNYEAYGGLSVQNGYIYVTAPTNYQNTPNYGILKLVVQPFATAATPILPAGYTGNITVSISKQVYTNTPLTDFVALYVSTSKLAIDTNTYYWGLKASGNTYVSTAAGWGSPAYLQYYKDSTGNITPLTGLYDQSFTYTVTTPLAAASYLTVVAQAYSHGGTMMNFYGVDISNMPAAYVRTATAVETSEVTAANVQASSIQTTCTVSVGGSLTSARQVHAITSPNEAVGGLAVQNGTLTVTQGTGGSSSACSVLFQPLVQNPILPAGYTGTITVNVTKSCINRSSTTDYVNLYLSSLALSATGAVSSWAPSLVATNFYSTDAIATGATALGVNQSFSYSVTAPLATPMYIAVYAVAGSVGAGTQIQFGGLNVTNVPQSALVTAGQMLVSGTVSAANLATALVTADTVAANAFVGNIVTARSLGNAATIAQAATSMGSTVMGHSVMARHLVASAVSAITVRAATTLTANAITANTVTARYYMGNGAGIATLNASALSTGTIPQALLPTTLVANTVTANTITASGSFTGSAAGLTGIPASQLTGTLPSSLAPLLVVTSGNPVLYTYIGSYDTTSPVEIRVADIGNYLFNTSTYLVNRGWNSVPFVSFQCDSAPYATQYALYANCTTAYTYDLWIHNTNTNVTGGYFKVYTSSLSGYVNNALGSSSTQPANTSLLTTSLVVTGGSVGIGGASSGTTFSVLGTANVTGALAAASFTGNAARLTGIPAANLVGTAALTTLSVGSGSATAPSLALSDATTGLYRPAANVLALTTAGIERVRFDSLGNFGVGTSAPSAPLHVIGNAIVTGTVTVGSGANLTGTLTAGTVSVSNTLSSANITAAGSVTTTGLLSMQQTTETLQVISGATGVVTHTLSNGAVWYHTSPAASFTVNLTNVPTTDNKTISITLFIVQGSTPYVPTAFQIDGVAQTLKWNGGAAPTGTASKTDCISFTLVHAGARTWSAPQCPLRLDARDLAGALSNNSPVSAWGGFTQAVASQRPTYYSSGGFLNGPYVSFNAANSQFLSLLGPQTFNIASHGGLTVMALVNFTGPLGTTYYEQVIGTPTGSGFGLVRLGGNAASFVMPPTTWNNTSTIVGNTWVVLTGQYNYGSLYKSIAINNVVTNGSYGALQTPDTTQSPTYVGAYGPPSASPTNYANINVSSIYVWDSVLSAAQMMAAYPQMIGLNASVGLHAQSLALTNGAAVSSWGSFTQSTASQQPTFATSGGYTNSPYVSFNAAQAQYLSAGPQTWHVASQGFTCVAQVMFTGSAPFGYHERIFDIGNQISLGRLVASSNLIFIVNTGQQQYVCYAQSGFPQNTWAVWAVQYAAGTLTTYVNNVLANTVTGATNVTDITSASTVVGLDQESSYNTCLNAQVRGVYMWDRALSTAELSTMYSFLTTM